MYISRFFIGAVNVVILCVVMDLNRIAASVFSEEKAKYRQKKKRGCNVIFWRR